MKRSDLNLDLIQEAILAVKPDYDQLSNEEKIKWRCNLSKQDEEKIIVVLIRGLFGVDFSHTLSTAPSLMLVTDITDDQDDEKMANIDKWLNKEDPVEEFLTDLDDIEKIKYNAHLLEIEGFGSSRVFFNEAMLKPIWSYANLDEYAFDDYLYQEENRKETDENYPGIEYLGRLYYRWLRMFVNDEFTYVTLASLGDVIFDRIFDHAQSYIKELVPHTLVPGESHGSQTQTGGILFDYVKNANGRECELNMIERRFYQTLVSEKMVDIFKEIEQLNLGATYIQDDSPSDGSEKHLTVIVSDRHMLPKVSIENFWDDVVNFSQPIEQMESIIQGYVSAVEKQIDDIHAQVLADLADGVIDFAPKKKQIVIQDPDLFDFLDSDEE